MVSAFFHLAVLDHENAAGVCNSGKPVGDHKNGLATAHIGKCSLDFSLIIRVRKSSCFVQNKDGGILKHHSGDI